MVKIRFSPENHEAGLRVIIPNCYVVITGEKATYKVDGWALELLKERKVEFEVIQRGC